MYNHSSNSSCTLESWPLRIFYSQKSATNAISRSKSTAQNKQLTHENGQLFFCQEETPVLASTVDSNPKIVTNLQGWSVSVYLHVVGGAELHYYLIVCGGIVGIGIADLSVFRLADSRHYSGSPQSLLTNENKYENTPLL